MHIKCDRDLLQEGIGYVQKAISSRTSMPILECFLLRCDESGFVMIATDQEIGIRTEAIECEAIEEGAIAVPSKFFSDIVRRLPDGKVSIKTKNYNITIKCGNSEFKISGRNPEEFPELPDVSREKKHEISQQTFKELIRQTIFAICQDESKPNLLGALVEIENNAISMVTCDTFRVCHKTGKTLAEGEEGTSESIIIPSKTINEMYKLLSENETMSLYVTQKHILFDIGRCIVVSRLIEGEFLNYKSVFPEDFETKAKMPTKEIENALERASLISYYENKKSPVKLKLSEGLITITTDTESGNFFEEISAEIEGLGVEISFNTKFLLEAVKCIDEATMVFKLNSPLSPCVLNPVYNEEKTDAYKYLVLPLRLKG